MGTDEVDSFLRGVASAPSVRPPPRTGDRLGDRYLIETFLGEGGMGSVFRALDEKLGEKVALKIVKPGLDEDALRDEVRLAQKVTHVNVCRTFDLEVIDGRSIVKMEYIAGETLAARLERDGKLPIDEAVRIARAIASGLGVAHAQGIVHNDLKPGNVMLDAERVVLMDFGVAHLTASPTDGVHGTVGYLAPEKLREQSGDARSDEYALGCVLYEMLAGERVFGTGAAVVIATRHVSDPAPDVRVKRSDVPRWLARATSRLLAKEPGSRAAGIAQLVTGPRSRMRIAAAIALFAIGAVLVGWRLVRPAPWVPHFWNAPVNDENLDAPSFSPDGKWILYSSDRLEKDRADHAEKWDTFLMSRETGRSTVFAVPGADHNSGDTRWTRDGQAVLVVEGASDPTVTIGYQQTYFRQPVAGSPPHAVGTPTLIAPRVTGVDDCGDAIVYTVRSSLGWRLMLHPAVGPDTLLFKAGAMQSVGAPRCDPSGSRIVTAIGPNNSVSPVNGDLYLIDRSTRQVHQLTHDHSVATGGPFANGGKTVVFSRVVDDRQQLYELDVATGSLRRLTDDAGPDGCPELSRDGTELMFTRDTTSWVPVLVDTAGNRSFLTRTRGLYLHGTPVDDDTLLYQHVSLGRSEVALIHITAHTLETLAGEAESPILSFDRKSIYFANTHTPNVLERMPVSGGTPIPVVTLPGRIVAGAAGPTGNHVLVEVDGRLHGYLVTPSSDASHYAIADEHVGGIVTEAPSGGWRAVTTFGAPTQSLALVPPGAALDQPNQTLAVTTHLNRWLDDHTIAFCTVEHCQELDVSTGQLNTRPQQSTPSLYAFEVEGGNIVSMGTLGQATIHIITNFADRDR